MEEPPSERGGDIVAFADDPLSTARFKKGAEGISTNTVNFTNFHKNKIKGIKPKPIAATKDSASSNHACSIIAKE